MVIASAAGNTTLGTNFLMSFRWVTLAIPTCQKMSQATLIQQQLVMLSRQWEMVRTRSAPPPCLICLRSMECVRTYVRPSQQIRRGHAHELYIVAQNTYVSIYVRTCVIRQGHAQALDILDYVRPYVHCKIRRPCPSIEYDSLE